MHTATTREVTPIPAGTGTAYGIIGETITFKVMQADTHGAFTVVEMLAQPGGGPPPHTHPSAEAFVILEGQIEFTGMDDGKLTTHLAAAGDIVHVPGGAVHTYRAVGDTPARTVIFLSPGGDMEQFFMEAGTPIADASSSPPTQDDLMAMVAIARKHGMEFLPPSEA